MKKIAFWLVFRGGIVFFPALLFVIGAVILAFHHQGFFASAFVIAAAFCIFPSMVLFQFKENKKPSTLLWGLGGLIATCIFGFIIVYKQLSISPWDSNGLLLLFFLIATFFVTCFTGVSEKEIWIPFLKQQMKIVRDEIQTYKETTIMMFIIVIVLCILMVLSTMPN